MTDYALSVENLNLWYGAFHALRGVDVALEPGRFLALLGPSGCGKTSLLRSIAGFVHPQQGSIRIDGTDVLTLKPRERNLGMVFQQYALFPHMTAAENVAFGLKCRGVGKAESDRRVAGALELVGLAAFSARKPRQLSGGQQQRVALARALVIEPQILLLDEPLGALDKKLRTQMQTELQMIQRRLGVTSVFVTHDQEEALAMADTIAIMKDGEIEQIGPPTEIFNEPRTRWVAEFVGAGNVVDGVLVPESGATMRVTGAPGCEFSVHGAEAGQNSIYVPADQLRLSPAAAGHDGEVLEVASHRYLGVHVEITAARDQQRLRALVSPKDAAAIPVGMPVIASAAPENCRLIAPT